MGVDTAIGWTDHTFNPWWGCTRVSEGCKFCYAETFAKRTGNIVWGKGQPRRFFADKHWDEPRKWDDAAKAAGSPALVFCASMADVFEDRADLVSHRARLFDLILDTPHLQWQLLTKRPENVMRLVPAAWSSDWPPNAWIGCTMENQSAADDRGPVLVEIPAPVLFVSAEPLLGQVDLWPWLGCTWIPNVMGIDCIIIGGESGPHHRPLDLAHARYLVGQANAFGVPVFFKQVGGQYPTSGGDELDGVRYKQFPAAAGR
jgi:protein gp37